MARRRDPSFAPPASELATPALDPPRVAVYPSAGQGFSLNEKGEVPVASANGRWTMEYVAVSVDIPNQGAHSGASINVAIPGLVVGDLCFFIGEDAGSGTRAFFKATQTVCATAGVIVLDYFNAETVTIDPVAVNHHFLVIHRFL